MTIKEHYLQYGFGILKGIFSKEEIALFRENTYKQLQVDEENSAVTNYIKSNAKHGVGDILGKKYLSNIILDSRVVKATKEILGKDIVYFGDGSYQVGVGLRGYHRDNVDRKYKNGPDWESEYKIIRFGLYLQNHKNFSGGLKVKPGTHQNATGKSLLLDIEEGDLIFWNLKLEHSGNAVRLKLFPNLPVDYLERFVPKFLKKEEDKERIALFFTYGVKGKSLDRYVKEYILKTPKLLEGITKTTYSDEVLHAASDSGINFINVLDYKG